MERVSSLESSREILPSCGRFVCCASGCGGIPSCFFVNEEGGVALAAETSNVHYRCNPRDYQPHREEQ